jgi:hypothetical protein
MDQTLVFTTPVFVPEDGVFFSAYIQRWSRLLRVHADIRRGVSKARGRRLR